MITMSFAGGDIMALGERIERQITDRVRTLVMESVRFVDNKVHARTPVNTGRAVRNMIWSMDVPNAIEYEPIESPADPGKTGAPTPLGVEARRPANTTAARQSLNALNFKDPFHAYILSNNASDIVDLERGKLPTSGMSRSPQGMFAITFAELVLKIKAGA